MSPACRMRTSPCASSWLLRQWRRSKQSPSVRKSCRRFGTRNPTRIRGVCRTIRGAAKIQLFGDRLATALYVLLINAQHPISQLIGMTCPMFRLFLHYVVRLPGRRLPRSPPPTPHMHIGWVSSRVPAWNDIWKDSCAHPSGCRRVSANQRPKPYDVPTVP